MLERFEYINHNGEKLEFGKGGLFANMSDLRDFTWVVNQKNNKISSFTTGVVSKTIPIIVVANDKIERDEMLNRFFEICEKDVLAVQHGRIIVGDYYLKCFVSAAKVNSYLEERTGKKTITITTDYPRWIKETSYYVKPYMTGIEDTNGGDYEYDYPHDYARKIPTKRIVNDGIEGVNFELTVYGPCENPTITIGKNVHRVNASLATGEYMKVNSIVKKVYKVKNNGEHVNLFHLRDREYDVFAKIEPGINETTWDGTFGFDITIMEERSEPKWS